MAESMAATKAAELGAVMVPGGDDGFLDRTRDDVHVGLAKE